MRIWKTLAFAAAIGAVSAAAPDAAVAQQTLRCESTNGDLKNCRVANLDENSVRLVQRLSQTECVNGQSWGTMPGIIWVESGCRAEFQYRTTGGNASGGRQQVTCESRGGGRNECVIPNLDLGSVRLEENLSQTVCNKDQNWGASRNRAGNRFAVWVSGGCRGVFSYRVNDDSQGGDMGGSADGRSMIRCESRGNARRECAIPNLDLGSVRLETNLSETACNQDQNWGASRNRAGNRFWIWVEGGCRGEFSYRRNN